MQHPAELRVPAGVLMLRSSHEYARLDPDRCVTRGGSPPGGRRIAMPSSALPPDQLLRPAVMTQSRPPRPPAPFRYREGRLCVGGLALDEVVAATGTPAYVYDLDAVAAAYRRVAAALEPPGGGGLYALKGNPTRR